MDSSSLEGEPLVSLYQLSLDFFNTISTLPIFLFVNPHIDWLGISYAMCIILILISASAVVSGSEVAYFSLSPQQLKNLEQNTSRSNGRILKLLQKPQQLLATILIANNLFNIGMVVSFYYLFNNLFNFTDEQWLLAGILNVGIVTFILVLLGEVMPKVYATNNNLRLAKFTSIPLSFMHKIFYPFSTILTYTTTALEKRIDARTQVAINTKEIDQAIDMVVANSSDESSSRDIDILKGIVSFNNITVKQIMHNRLDIFAVDKETSFKELLSQIVNNNFSRVPVYQEDLDHIVGLLYAKDLLVHLNAPADFKWNDLIREAFFVPETKKINDLLKEIQNKHPHLAIVVDEYGGTAGLVTLEDILEEIVGDIKDEFDDDEGDIDYKKIGKNRYSFNGKTNLHDVCKALQIESNTFADVQGDAESLAGLLLELHGEFLEKNESVQYNQFKFTVQKKIDNRIDRIKIDISPDTIIVKK